MTTIEESPSLAVSGSLQQKIHTLSTDTQFEEFPLDDGNEEDLVLMKRKEAEEFFQRAMCRRIWWRLTAKERSEIRASLIAHDPSYKRDMQSDLMEYRCIKEIERMLKEGKTAALVC